MYYIYYKISYIQGYYIVRFQYIGWRVWNDWNRFRELLIGFVELSILVIKCQAVICIQYLHIYYMYYTFGYFLINVMQSPPPPQKNGHIYMKDAH